MKSDYHFGGIFLHILIIIVNEIIIIMIETRFFSLTKG
jgi:hypothetical protein